MPPDYVMQAVNRYDRIAKGLYIVAGLAAVGCALGWYLAGTPIAGSLIVGAVVGGVVASIGGRFSRRSDEVLQGWMLADADGVLDEDGRFKDPA